MQCIGKHNSIWHTRTWQLRVPILCCYSNNWTVTQRWGMSVICPLLSFPDQRHIAQMLNKSTQVQKPSHLQPELEGMDVSHTGLATPPLFLAPDSLPPGCGWGAWWPLCSHACATALGSLSQMPAGVNPSSLCSSSQDVTVCHHDEKDNMDPLLSSESAIAGQGYLTTAFWIFPSTLRILWWLGHTQIIQRVTILWTQLTI